MTDGRLDVSDAEAALAARRELGADYEREAAEAFADRVERVVEQRVADRLAERTGPSASSGGQVRQLVLGVVSVVVGIPVTIVPVVAADGGLPAVVVAWLGIAGVNIAHASTVNGRRPRPPA